MGKINLKNRMLSGLLAMSIMASLITAIVIAIGDGTPTVYIEGLTLQMKGEYYTDDYGRYSTEEKGELAPGQEPIPIMNGDGKQRQSIQALVEISVANLQYCAGAYVPVRYNDKYLVPSDWKTNGVVSANKSADWSGISDTDDALHHLFFHTNEELYVADDEPADPFAWGSGEGDDGIQKSQIMNVGTSVVAVQLNLDANLLKETENGTKAGKVVHYKTEYRGEEFHKTYLDLGPTGKENRVALGTLSFRVNPEAIEGVDINDTESLLAAVKTLAETYNGGENGLPKGSADQSLALFEAYLAQSETDTDVKNLKMFHIKNTAGKLNKVTDMRNLRVNINVDTDDVLVKAEPVKKDVTINAYQAYTRGAVSDLALTMQKYAESVRTTYVSGKLEDKTIYWGETPTDCVNMPDDGPGMFIQKGTIAEVEGEKTFTPDTEDGTIYRFRWGADGVSYTLEKKGDSGWEPATFAYDPRGGQYKISQFFTYWEKNDSDELIHKAYPIAIEVLLTVTPVNLTGAFVDNRTITYKNTALTDDEPDGAPTLFAALDLADEAKLTLDTMINGVVPTMPVAWTPDKLTSAFEGVPGVGHPGYGDSTAKAKWPFTDANYTAGTGIGDYTFNTAKITQTAVRARYPWLTTDAAPWQTEDSVNYFDFEAVRRIVKVDGEPELASLYHMEAAPYESPLGSEVGLLKVTLWKGTFADDGTTRVYQNMPVGYKFRLYMPNGQEILVDPAFNSVPGQWFGPASGENVWNNGAGFANSSYQISRATAGENGYYEFVISPGDLNATDTYAGQRETLRRYINLGGWFSADILPPADGAEWVERVSAYSEPRTNVYIKSYTWFGEDDPAESNPVQRFFNYTGDARYGLRPFYKNSRLSNFISLLADESVATRYDYFDGSQPGSMRQFLVESSATYTVGEGDDAVTQKTWNRVLGDKSHTAPPWSEAVKDEDGTITEPAEIVTYGFNSTSSGNYYTPSDYFARSHDYSNFGRVLNPDTGTPFTGYATDVKDRQVVVKVQVQDGEAPVPPEGDPSVLLTYQLSGDSISYIYYDDAPTVAQVKRVTFEPKAEGYTYQQVVTLTLTNDGSTEIKGIHIDVPKADDGQEIPYFTILSAPAVNLAPGASTTFQISYIPNLTKGTYANLFTDDSLPIYIYDENETLLRKFEALIRITEGKVHRVDLVVHPGEMEDVERLMGDAALVAGMGHEDSDDEYDDTLAPNSYITGDIFWVLTTPKDEYDIAWKYNDTETAKIPQVYFERDYINEEGNPATERIYLHEYPAGRDEYPGSYPAGFDGANRDFVGENKNCRLFWIEMPDQSITVHVRYYEPVTSKLRLSDLLAFSWDDKGSIDGTYASGWGRESVVGDQERPVIPYADPYNDTDATDYWDKDETYSRYNRQLHATQEENYAKVVYDEKRDEYIVILKELNNTDPALNGDEWCGVSVKLRQLAVTVTGVEGMPEYKNQNIVPYVVMRLDDASETAVGGIPIWGYTDPAEGGPTNHHSSVFAGPKEADADQNFVASRTVTITVSYDGTADGEPDSDDARYGKWVKLDPPESGSRTYKVRFVRKVTGEAKHTSNAGNSPYGMIENSSIADKAAAKKSFAAQNRFTNPAYTPSKAAGMKNIYWPEAWGWEETDVKWKYQNTDRVNYDRDETALFVYLGQEFYDPGVMGVYNNAADLIRNVDVRRTIENVYPVKTSETSATGRFSNGTIEATATSIVDLGTIHVQDTDAGAGVIPGATYSILTTVGETEVSTEYSGLINTLVTETGIRPGVYKLTYTFPDYDDPVDDDGNHAYTSMISFTRPLIILAPNGDVNADLKLNSSDVRDPNAIWGRFADNLPHESLSDTIFGPADKLLYRYRMVDANNDRNVNDVDADQIRNATTSGFATFSSSGDPAYGTLKEFYRPTDYISP